MASLVIRSETEEGVMLSHLGAILLKGRADEAMPLPLPFICILPMLLIEY